MTQPTLPELTFNEPVKVTDDIFGLKLPLPFALDHVHCWLIDDGDGWTIIDTGVNNPETRATWETALTGLMAGKPVNRLLLTHFHPDHAGLGGWLAERTGAQVSMSLTEWMTVRALKNDTGDGYNEAHKRYYEAAGIDPETKARLLERGNMYAKRVVEPVGSIERLRAHQTIKLAGSEFRIIIGEGHAPEMVTLYSEERNLLIAADQILPKISPVVGAWVMTPWADPLDDFLTSNRQYESLPADTLVLPSHGWIFQTLLDRVHDLAHHHERRLDRTLAILDEPKTAWEVSAKLFERRLDLHQSGFALGETIAHLNHLIGRNEIASTQSTTGALTYFRAAS